MRYFDNWEFKCGWYVLVLVIVGVVISFSLLLLYSFSFMVIFLEWVMGWVCSDLQVVIIVLLLGIIVVV